MGITRPETHVAERAPAQRMFAALKDRDFRWFWISRLCADTGLWFQTTAQMWLIYELTGSPFHLGLVGVFRAIPQISLALVGGAIADRMDKRRFIQITQSTNMLLTLILATLTLFGGIQVWQIYGLALLMGFVSALDGPARQAIMGELVGPQDIPNAVALNGASHNGTRVVGPSLSGIIIALWGTASSFYLNALLIGIGVLALSQVKTRLSAGARQQSIERALIEVFQYVGASPKLFALIGIVAMANFFGGSVISVMAIFAAEVIQPGPFGIGPGPHVLGFLSGASAFGAFAASLWVAGFLAYRPDKERLVVFGSMALGLWLILFASSTWLVTSFILMVLFGITFTSASTLANGLVQTSVSDQIRGRVMSLWWMSTVGMMPLGGIWAGVMGSLLTVPVSVTLSGFIIVLFVLPVGLRAQLLIEKPTTASATIS